MPCSELQKVIERALRPNISVQAYVPDKISLVRWSVLLVMVAVTIPTGVAIGSSILLLFFVEFVVDIKIQFLKGAELKQKLRSIYQDFSAKGLEYMEVKEPPSRAISLLRTWRRNQWRLISPNLLAKGDVVQCAPDEDIGVESAPLDIPELAPDLFEIRETPLEKQLITALRDGTINQKFPVLDAIRLLFDGLFFASFLIVTCLGRQPVHCWGLFCVAILGSPLLKLVYDIYGNARLLSLVEVLQKSKTPYLESDEVDEFDEEAPPPTKDIYLDLRHIFTVAARAFSQELDVFLFWGVNLVQDFAKVSVLSFVDREGPIAMVSPNP